MSPELYYPLRHVHILSVIISITLFVYRGSLMMARSTALERRLWRVLPHIVDTVLLVSGVGLIVLSDGAPLYQSWLQFKLVLVVLYIVTGAVALRHGRTYAARRGAFVLAMLTLAGIVITAIRQQPLGL